MSLVPQNITSIAEDDTIGAGKNIVAGAAVSITKSGGGMASIYSDAAGTTPITLPTVTDPSGELSFYIASGSYVYTIAGAPYPVFVGSKDEVTTVETFAALATTPATTAGMVVYVKQHTSGGIGGGHFQDASGTITNDGGTLINNTVTAGRHWRRINYPELFVDDFGAIGNGTTDDSAAFLLMAAATGGAICVKDKAYLINQLNLPDYTSVKIVGDSMPSKNSALTQLVDGSILIGGIASRSTYLHLEKFGLDNGSARALVGITDGGVFNALTGSNATSVFADSISVMGPTSAGTTHGFLLQGHESGKVNNVYCGKHQFGIVIKGRNMQVTNIDGDDCRTALLYPKSDIPAVGGNVGDATANKFTISGVSHRAAITNTTAAAVYLHASTAAFAEANAVNVFQDYGECALKLQGGGLISDPTISGVNASNISATRSTYTVMANGYTYDWSLNNITANNNSTGRAIYSDTTAFGWNVNGVKVVVSDAAIVSTVAMHFYGQGAWDNIAIRNPFNTMTVNVGAGIFANVRCGKISGNGRNLFDENLVGINGAVAGADAPIIRIMPNSVLKLSGRFNLTASANKFFCNLPVNTGKQQVFACGGIDSLGDYVTVAVRLNDFQLSIEPSLPVGFQQIDLSGLSINL